jgi:Flp pilus assembly protein TadG
MGADMMMTLHRILKRFHKNEAGTIALLAGLTMPVLALAVGISMDISNAVRARAQLQAASDAGSLSAAVFLNRHGDDRAEVRKAQQTAERVTRENLIKSIGRQASGQVSITNFSAADGVVSFDARFRNPNFFAGIVGYAKTPVNIETEALYGGDGQLPVRVAMVLDNSGSMSGAKLNNLKDAARRFVQIIEDADDQTDEDEVHIGLVPFSSYVNVGTDKRGVPWLEIRGESSRQEQHCWQPRRLVSESNCRVETYPPRCRTSVNDGVETRTCHNGGTRRVCDRVFEDDGPRRCEMRNVGATWDGCITTRRQRGHYARPFFQAQKFLGMPRLECPRPITTLTNNYNTVRNEINALNARGNTMIAQGVQWGRILLENAVPFPIPDEEERDLEYLVIMTDGSNTLVRENQNANRQIAGERVGVAHVTHETDANVNETNDDTVDFCQAARQDDIRVMTIAFDVSPGSDAHRIMRDCASDPSLFFPARNAADLRRAFEDIAEQINRERFKVRLSS